MDSVDESLPTAIIGAGPIGLAAAAHLAELDVPFVIFERGERAASAVREWGHVRLFTPWQYNIDEAARRLLDSSGWQAPADDEAFPTGAELVAEYLEPLAAHPAIAPHLRYGQTVTAVAHAYTSKHEAADRDLEPFAVHVRDSQGATTIVLADYVIDASGSWGNPNPAGANGLPVPGERELASHIAYRIPDVLGNDRSRYAGKRVLVIGSGHSAMNALSSLVDLATTEGSEVHWALRRPSIEDALRACSGDGLTERALLSRDIHERAQSDAITLHTGVRVDRFSDSAGGIVTHAGDRELPAVDEIIVATGFRPDLAMLRELRLDLHPLFESPYALGSLIDPANNACGTVPPHTVEKLAHPDADFYIAGMKSYGRASTFLMLTGYEQVRSIACALAGDRDGALEVRLSLPERGLCSACTAYLEEQDRLNACTCSDDEEPDACCATEEPAA
jgi:thioredoxin reductase